MTVTDPKVPGLSPDAAARDLRPARAAAILAMPIAPVAALVADGAVVKLLVASLMISAVALLSQRAVPAARPLLVALALVGHCILLTAALAGHPWQIDAHMTYFAALAIVATMGSVPALLVAVAATAVHHLSLGLLLPALVYPSSDILGNLTRTVLHAAIVLAEAGVLLLAMTAQARARRDLEEGRRQLAVSFDAATVAHAAAEQARQRAVRTADHVRDEGRRVATAVEQVAAAAQRAARHAADSKRLVSSVRHDSDRSLATVGATTDAMDTIRDSAADIGAVVELIDDIARRTDLLALNAAVESARAGEAGRGFAVVAKEVRKLAQQSADATMQIRTLVTGSGQRVEDGARLVGEGGAALQRIAGAISDLDTRMTEISSGATEQSISLEEVKRAIARLDAIAAGDARTDDIVPDQARRKAA